MVDLNTSDNTEAMYFTPVNEVSSLSKEYTANSAGTNGQKSIWKIQGQGSEGEALLNTGTNRNFYSNDGSKQLKMPFPNGIWPN
jgi:hypothetical protein